MSDSTTELRAAWRAHVARKGNDSAEAIIARFVPDPDEPGLDAVPGGKVDEAIAALREGLPAGRKPMRSPDEQAAGLMAMAPKVYARWNAIRRPPKAEA